MRDGSSRTASLMTKTGTSRDVSVDHWRTCVRPTVITDLAEGTKSLPWTNALLVTLLEELHITEEFDALIGQRRFDADRDAAPLLALALFLRHSWDPTDLADVVDRVLFPVDDITVLPHATTTDRARGHRDRPEARTSPSGTRARKEQP